MTIQEFQTKMQQTTNHGHEDQGKLMDAVRNMARHENSTRILEENLLMLNPWF